MNMQKLTQKSLESIQLAQTTATEYGNPQVEQIHLLSSLLSQEQSLTRELMQKCGVDPESLSRAVQQALSALPRVSGGGREADKIYVSRELDLALNEAEKQAEQMRDEYVSVEHLMLGLIEKPDATLKRLFAA
ncbi:MAG: type VI secretion system ATPase TssH, partial [Clostridia bacterium]|nr:type VI secretion system ATPase TssH [Clostridia bacterium]